jgi:hypothetical protein
VIRYRVDPENPGGALIDGLPFLPRPVPRFVEQVTQFHHARNPPCPIRIKRDQPRRREGHDRNGAQVLHRTHQLLARLTRLAETVFLGQQEIPKPQGCRRWIKFQTA